MLSWDSVGCVSWYLPMFFELSQEAPVYFGGPFGGFGTKISQDGLHFFA